MAFHLGRSAVIRFLRYCESVQVAFQRGSKGRARENKKARRQPARAGPKSTPYPTPPNRALSSFLPAFSLARPLLPSFSLISSEPPAAPRAPRQTRTSASRARYAEASRRCAPATQEPPGVTHFSLDPGPSRPVRPSRPSRRQPSTLISAASGAPPGHVLDPQPAAERGSDNRRVESEGPGFRAC